MDYRQKNKNRHSKTFRGKHRTFFDINYSNIFFDPLPRVMKISNCDLINVSFYIAKETMKKDEKTTLKREKKLQMKQLTKD